VQATATVVTHTPPAPDLLLEERGAVGAAAVEAQLLSHPPRYT
jgi:hypothetical protein